MNVKIEISLQHAPQVVATLALAVAVVLAVVPALLVAEALDELAQKAFRMFLFHFP